MLLAEARGKADKQLASLARRTKLEVWEFKSLQALREAYEVLTKRGIKAMAFSRSDELLLGLSQLKRICI